MGSGLDAPDFDSAFYGQALPEAAARALQDASAWQADSMRSLGALMRAQCLAPDHPAVLIARYRSHFYGHRWRSARAVAEVALSVGAAPLGLSASWRDVLPFALPGARDDPATRFYLFALKGYAYLSLRLGHDDDGSRALHLLRRLDPQDRVGWTVLESARQRAWESDDE
jgi:hypothetical protein